MYDEHAKEVLPFHKIRKHVTRSGSFLGTELDSQAHSYERLILVFYDCLLVDDEVTMAKPYSYRRRQLHKLLHDEVTTKIDQPPLLNRSNWARVDFSKHGMSKCTKLLEQKLSEAIAGRCEGLILKPCDSPYFSLDNSKGPAGKIIKLKKDYISGLGDSADFAVIGARRDLRALGTVTTKWTHFQIATLENKQEVLRFGAKSVFKAIDSLTRPCIPVKDMEHMTQHGSFMEEQVSNDSTIACFTIIHSGPETKMDVTSTLR